MKSAEYRKFFISLVPVVLAGAKVLSDAIGVGHVTSATWSAAGVAVLTAIGVWGVRNEHPVVAPAVAVTAPNVTSEPVHPTTKAARIPTHPLGTGSRPAKKPGTTK